MKIEAPEGWVTVVYLNENTNAISLEYETAQAWRMAGIPVRVCLNGQFIL